MKTEERKKEDCELLYDFMVYSMKQERTGFKDVLSQFKADNDLLPKPKLEFNRWIVNDNYPEWICFMDSCNDINYGITESCEWFCFKNDGAKPNQKTERYATEAEILEKLSAMAEKMGYVEGVKIKFLSCNETETKTKSDKFWIYNNNLRYGNIMIMKNGKWAKIITPNIELSKEEWNERTGEVQVKINELEEKLNELRKLV